MQIFLKPNETTVFSLCFKELNISQPPCYTAYLLNQYSCALILMCTNICYCNIKAEQTIMSVVSDSDGQAMVKIHTSYPFNNTL